MNVEQANAIPMSKILESMGYMPVKQEGADHWYNSPCLQNDVPGFYVNATKNTWHDFGTDKGGKVVDFVCSYLESQQEDHTIVDALRWLDVMQGCFARHSLPNAEPAYTDMSLHLRKVAPLRHSSLVAYLRSKGISPEIAGQHLKEITVNHGDHDQEFYAIGLPNEDGGFEVRNETFKGRVAPTGVSVIRGRVVLPDTVHVFKSFMDFLSVLTYQDTDNLDGDIIILNSTSFLPMALPYIKGYSYRTIHTWLDNNTVGLKATQILTDFAKRQGNLSVRPMNKIYAGQLDVNAWHCTMLNL